MMRTLVTISRTADRERAMKLVGSVPFGTRVEIKEARRSIPQNDRMWAMLTEISQQKSWYGVTLTPNEWKLVFIDALKSELRMVPNIYGNGFVNLRQSSSDLSKGEMSDLIELMHMFGAQWGIVFSDPRREADWCSLSQQASM